MQVLTEAVNAFVDAVEAGFTCCERSPKPQTQTLQESVKEALVAEEPALPV